MATSFHSNCQNCVFFVNSSLFAKKGRKNCILVCAMWLNFLSKYQHFDITSLSWVQCSFRDVNFIFLTRQLTQGTELNFSNLWLFYLSWFNTLFNPLKHMQIVCRDGQKFILIKCIYMKSESYLIVCEYFLKIINMFLL